ncbi:SDR family NAD(P)-dependent oxidoreductase [Fulvivirga ulvae]|uniref:SDR family NAD(P)-dependent oxidoreductase n=1 Tax=Fulvivirga ulvae TaxID=2904245 RepID=UPI001F1A08F7|nr:SDR family NAD(P)-dependent oxidoreductase [Fulvivirga ulvae]UII31931.1 SDR family NAD(P)-dependent oxidoreductase [Fulvivirga ulvae]
MLKLLKFCCHGYVAVPVIEACHKQGLFTLLDKNKYRKRTSLIKELKANEGYFSMALQALESLGWLESNPNDAYRLTDRVDKYLLNLDLASLYTADPEALLRKTAYAAAFGKKIDKILLKDLIKNTLTASLVRGAILTPLVTGLKQAGAQALKNDEDNFAEVLSGLDKNLAQSIEKLFVQQAWMDPDTKQLTPEGRQLLQAEELSEIVAFRPVLHTMSDLLFGDGKPTWENKEAALRATLTGKQNHSCKQDLQQEIISIFDQPALDRQPRAIAGLGDSMLLKDIYRIIQDHTLRGRNLEQYPLQIIAFDRDDAELEKASQALKSAGIEHQALSGDINKPEDICRALKGVGLEPAKEVVYLHTFAHHALTVDANKNTNGSLSPMAAGQLKYYLDKEGQLLDAMTVLRHWQRHLQAWADSIGQSRLLVQEAHTLPADITFEYLDRSGNFYIDTIHGLSHQYLIGAEAFLILAANAGLFNKYQVKGYPELSSYSRISLHHLTRRDYSIRFATEGDIKTLLELEELCWKEPLRTSKAQILARIRQYPEGQFVLEKEGNVLGVIYSQRIANDAEIEKHDSGNVHELHDPAGAIIQLIAVNIHPDTQNLGYGDQLLEFMLQRCSLVPGVNRVVAVSLCKNYNAGEDLPIERYIQQKGSKQDPIMAFHDAHGARIVKPIANYRPLDYANQGYGVLIEYDILSRVAQNNRNRSAGNDQPLPVQEKTQLSESLIRQFLKDAATGLLDVGTIDFDRPVMETGLSSVDLMALQKQIEEKFNQPLQPGFFFEYNNLNKVVDYLSTLAAASAPSGVPAKESRAQAVDKQQISQYLLEKVNALLDISITPAEFDRPIMEIGLNSADLLLLQKQIEEKFNTELQAGFFFEYNNLNKVIDFLSTQTSALTSTLHVEVKGQEKSDQTGGEDMLDTDIAVVGVSCKLPGGIESAEELWEALASSKSMISPFPKERGLWPSGAERPGVDKGGFLHQGDTFDAAFFRMSPKEAQATDPQQRILLELAWACLEDASIVPAALKGSDTGVFIGASNCDYYRLMQSANLETQAHHAIGSSLAVLANRISYFYDFNGPSLIIDTACSASLVALHTAIRSLQSAECSAALVGGVNFICYPDLSVAYQSAGMLSPDSKCKVFDASANGYVRSEGAVMLMLKPLRKAIEDKDQIRAVIKGSAVNHGGLGGGLTVPNPQKQSELYTAAWKNAGISPQKLSYIEAHGTGTSLGDPIEIQGIKTAYSKLVPVEEAKACSIGSVKSNVGHLESAAGITGLLKVILAMQHRQIPASINYKDLNPKIQLEGTSFRIQNALQTWEAEAPRLAGVSSFGSGGANAHVVVQEFATDTKETIEVDHNLFVLSAASQDRLREYAEKVIHWSENAAGSTSFTDAIYSWQIGRMPMKHRLAISVTGWEDLRQKLQQWLTGEESAAVWTGQVNQSSGEIQQQATLQLTEKGLEKIAQQWIAGADIDWTQLYTKDIFGENLPRRISLPGYPFAKNRHWIDITGITHQTPEKRSEQVTIVQPQEQQQQPVQPVQIHIDKPAASGTPTAQKFTLPSLKKPSNVSLATPETLKFSDIKVQAKKVPVSLTSTSTGMAKAAPTGDSYVSLFDNGNGIYEIKINDGKENNLSQEVAAQLVHALKHVKKASAKVLMLSGNGSVFLQGGREAFNLAIEENLYHTLASFPCPVIAIIRGDARGAGFMAGALCDFMVCSEEGTYTYRVEGLLPTVNEEQLLKERFGEAFARDLLYQATAPSGKDLKAKGYSFPIVPSAQVEAYALKLAEELARKSEASLSLLRQHLGRHILACTEQLMAAGVLKEENTQANGQKKLTSGSKYLKIENPAEQILTIRIKQGRKKYQLKDLTSGLTNILGRVEKSEYYKAIILTSDDPEFISVADQAGSANEVLQLQQLITGSPVPVLAAIESNAKDTGWLIAQSCDVCIYNEQGVYIAAHLMEVPALAQSAAMIFGRRLGHYVCKEILLAGKAYTGAELKQQTGAITIAEDALAEAIQLAGQWTKLSYEDVTSWKKERAAATAKAIEQQPDWLESAEAFGKLPAAPTAIDLKSQVIKATIHPEGIVEVKMEDREARNMFSPAFMEGITEVFGRIAQKPACKVVILTGYDSYFISGGTKEMLLDIQEGKIKFTDSRIYHLAMECNVPVIAAMQGHGIGAGWSMGMFADFILFSDESHYVSPYMNYGFTPGAGSTMIFPDKTGYDLARETLLTAVEYSGRELKNKGLLLPVLPRKEVMATAFDLARQIAAHPRAALVALKHQLTAHLQARLEENYALELAMHEKTFVGQSETLKQIQSNFHQEGKVQATQPVEAVAQHASVHADVQPAILAALKAMLAQELHMEESDIDEDSQFVDLGLDSIIGVTWIRKINEKYKIQINATKVYSYPNLKQFSSYVKELALQAGTITQAQAPVVPQNAPAVTADVQPVILATLKAMLAQELHMEESDIDEDSQFVDLGLDSIIGVTWIRKINEKYKVQINATKVYSYPNLKQFSSYVKEEAEKSGTLPVEVKPAQESQPVMAQQHISAEPLTQSTKGTSAKEEAQAIAIIGMAGQFPEARNVEEFWQNIAGGKNCIREIPKKRWDIDQYYQEGGATPGKTYSRWMGALEEYDLFDPLFFNISPSEAESMDPQQRLFLQACWHAIENAGYNPKALGNSKCGVFVGCGQGDYHLLSRDLQISAYGFTGGDNSILAARISYFLNLQGPCLTIDTACSSSLVAIANACDSLALGKSDMVLAGGVYIGAGPDMHLKTSQMGMLSPDGKCYTFDQRANGFVPGEGVGVVMLKRLEDAEKDNDNILGVIQGWGVNQDGKTNGITAPNTEAQSRLQQEVYDKYKIDPASIQLVEAHGTGTKLGDPIEVEALVESFKKYTQEKEYCALGSVKSNIGHCLMAAGVAGMIKLVMSMKHKQLPPTINFEKLNEHISLDNSPFYVNTELKDWKVADAELRKAAISSFGFSGTNAHIVVSEYPSPVSVAASSTSQNVDCIIPLSARTEEQLKQKAIDLLDYIRKEGQSLNLADIAYTLQIGRMDMGQRLGLVANSVDQLAEKLQAFVEGKPATNLFAGTAKRNEDTLSLFAEDMDLQETIDKWIQQKKLSNLVNLWVKGYELDWNKMYGNTKPKRTHLPLYPFAKERYWIDAQEALYFAPATAEAVIHPLLHRNTSTLNQQRFSSIFSGDEPYLDQVNGVKVLPELATLEMARAAVEHSLSSPSAKIELRNIVWAEPMIADTQKTFNISLYEKGNGLVAYEISSEAGNEEIIYSQGEASLSHSETSGPVVNIEQLKGQMIPGGTTITDQELTNVLFGETQFLARLSLPDHTANGQSGFGLYPAIMKHTLRAADIFRNDHQQSTPVNLRSVRILSSCTSAMYVWGRFSQQAGEQISLDVDLCDNHGNVCVEMRGLALKVNDQQSIQAFVASDKSLGGIESFKEEETTQPLFFNETWEARPHTATASVPADQQTLIFTDKGFRETLMAETSHPLSRATIVEQSGLPANQQEIARILKHHAEAGKNLRIIYMWTKGQGEAGIHMLFDLFKAIKSSASTVAHVTLAGHYDPSKASTCWDYSWIGFERSLKLILPNIQLSLLYTDTGTCTPQQLLDAAQHQGVLWYRHGKRYLLSLQTCKPGNTTGEPVLKQSGSYLITGGCGNLGLQFARYLAENYHANLVLTGRRQMNADIEAQINTLKAAGAGEVSYHTVDVSSEEAVRTLKAELPFEITGIIHAAGVESSEPFYNRSTENINAVLRPKSIGSMLLDEAFDQPSLDFICYFSSVSAFLGDFGSCDYAVASRFQMAYSHYREQKGHHGKTIVINWPLWQEGGMGTADSAQTSFYLKSSGQEPLQTAQGIGIWHDLLKSDRLQTLVMLGKPSRVEQVLRRSYQEEQSEKTAVVQATTNSIAGKGWKPQYQGLSLKACITTDLKQVVSALTKISQNQLNITENLTDYGFDSISLSELAKRLTNHFGVEITPAVFFSATTIDKLSEYFQEEHADHIEAFYSQAKTMVSSAPAKITTNRLKSLKQAIGRRYASALSSDTPTAVTNEPIAVVGMSGRFPQARTVEELWTLLAEGKDAITEIPANRWDWRKYFTTPGDENNTITTNKGGFIHGVDEFDPLFFEISPREAEQMDPAERLLLMETYKAIEDARVSPGELRGQKVGVFVGMEEGQYDLITGKQGITTTGNAMISSRLSYFLDLHGPAIATNTACSSGLVALHQAVTSLRQGECKSAIVAGVSLLISPDSYVMMSEAGMLSQDGHCHTFSKNAGGIGVGESVVVLMLKPLSAAVADGDSIYGTIKASGINFDGKTNGVTAPNGDRQAELIEKVYSDYQIDTHDLSYIVTHGTGTKLGDPVEINALAKAFKKLNSDRPSETKQGYCALTSCKSNIGHTLAASGLVSVVNLLKAIQYRQIPASLNCEEENDYITWNNSPFFINKATREWDKEQGKPYLGAVSSFGRSGTNAHVVIEEYQSVTEEVQTAPVTHLNEKVAILLSARTEEQLQQKVRDLFELTSSKDSIDLQSLAYSLQVCREEFEVRLGFLVSSVDQLAEKLQAYLDGAEDIEDTCQGKVKRNQEDMSIINDDEDMKEAIDKWINRRKLSKLLELWVKGLTLDWKKFYGENKPKRMALPTYPFAQDRYWIDAASKGQYELSRTQLHPLVHRNTSDLLQQSYSSTFRGSDLLVGDYHYKENTILPAAAYLEMARAAVEMAMPAMEEPAAITLHQLEWAEPCIVNQEHSVRITLAAQGDELVSYEIFSTEAGEELIHFTGFAAFTPQPEALTLDVTQLMSHMGETVEVSGWYHALESAGVNYGRSLRAISAIHLGSGEALVKLKLTVAAEGNFILHPAIMDSVFTAGMALIADAEPLVPVALDSVTTIAACAEEMYAWVRFSPGAKASDEQIKLDIDLCDLQGNVAVIIEGLELTNLSAASWVMKGTESGTALSWDQVSYLTHWEEQPVQESNVAVAQKNVLIVCGDTTGFEKDILAHYRQDAEAKTLLIRVADKTKQLSDQEWQCGADDPDGFRSCLNDVEGFDTLYFISMAEPKAKAIRLENLIHGQESNEVQLLRLIKYLKQSNKISDKVESYVLTQDTHAIHHEPNQFTGAGNTGLAYSLAQSSYQFRVRNLDLSSEDLKTPEGRKNTLDRILQEPPADRGEVFKLQSGKRYRQVLYKLNWNTQNHPAIRERGVYLIVGGTGTVGKIMTRNLIEKYDATVVWLGRSEETSERVQAAMQRFDNYADNLLYVQADTTDPESMKQAVASIKQKHQTIQGAMFAGMVFRFENSLDQTTESEFRSIFDLKAQGSWVFYDALKDEPLDFMCYFSSGQAYSFSGASKLSAYACGITYSDSLVHAIRQQAKFPVGIINWGFWKSTTENITETKDKVSKANFDALEDLEGFKCFEQFVGELQQGRIHQVLCMKASQHIETLMNCNREDYISLTGAPASSSATLDESEIEVPYEKIKKLKLAEEKSDLEDWLVQLLFCQIDQLVKSAGLDKPRTVSGLREQCGVLDKYTPWWEACLNRLNQNKYIQWKGDTITQWKKVDAETTWKKWQVEKEKYLQNPDRKAWVGLVNDCLERIPDILQGKTLATDVIFPNSSMEKVEGVYKNNLMSDTFNEIVANAVVAYVQQKLEADPNARLRMLEIGAGTGGTSAVIFNRLQPYKVSIEKYCYTDLSKAFFFHAEKNYLPDNPYITCQRLDIEQPVDDQGIEVGTYDLVIATNVLHATRDIRRTLRNAKAVLHQEGYILINELSTPALFNHLTFGLLDGWWLFTDAELRMPGSPGLYPAGWQRVLEEEGFPAVLFPAEEAHLLGQQIILAQSDGAIRRKISVKTKEKIAPKTPAVVKTKPVQIPVQKQKAVQMKKPQPAAKPSLNIQDYIRTKILSCLSETLKISADGIDPDIAFSDYGIDSILGVSFINQINEALKISLNTAIIFEHSTVNRLSKHVMNSYQSQIEPDIEAQAIATVEEETETVSQVFEERTAGRVNVLPQSRFTFRNKQSSRLAGTANTKANTSEIAVVGISGMFPKAENIEAFWHNLEQGIDGVDELPERYLDQKNFFSPKKQAGKTRCKWGGIVEDRDCFDPLFFNISPKEAESMNPHQRLVLQESWNALENAGYNPRTLSGSQTGIYIGAEPTGYSGDTFTGYSDAIIASRLSYILNLNGPSFVVNTGCSSSAVALHLACESLRNRESDMALAGGVNACLEQNMLIRLDEIEMLSPGGRCFTFDESANGTIMSEGVGIVVLKRLDDAIEAGDKIYGLISGSGINQDGASNGITAPNGEAQEKLIVDVYKKFNIDPEKISYVEAHGTGTKLGDPVETNALVRAFRTFTESKEFCAVGSAKSYIGHTAAAAGVIGLIKVLLSMQHNKIPKLLNFKTLNPLIEFNGSPFYINTEVQDWEPSKDGPRMAAINSFGHSGTNAHLVVKEFIQPERKPVTKSSEPVIVPLSAKTPEQLMQKATALLKFVQVSQEGTAEVIDLVEMAYTLQIGREAMEERFACIVNSVEELADKLQAFVNGERNIQNTWVGQAKRNKDIHALFSGDLDLQEIIDKWIAKNKLSSLADLWVKGLDLDWLKLYHEVKPHKAHLPSYPFAKERYWYQATKGGVQTKPTGLVGAVIHPLLHQNTSDLNQLSYTTTFSGEEFFLADHRVNESKILPAVAYLEMARVAANMALPVHDEPFILELHNTVWLKPVVVEGQKQVTIALFESEEDGAFEKIDFEIYSLDNGTDDQDGETIHCQGQAIFGRHEIPARLDIDRLRAQMQHGTIEPDTVYDAFRQMGTDYGPAHQCVTAVYIGENQLLAHLSMQQDSQHDYILHPAMMDCALQACIGLMLDLDDLPSSPLLPFALESVRVIAACTEEMHVWARYVQGSQPGDKLIKLDIDLCDQEGNVCVQMHGFSSRSLDGQIEHSTQKSISSRSYDDGFYNNIIEKILNNELTVEEAAELD